MKKKYNYTLQKYNYNNIVKFYEINIIILWNYNFMKYWKCFNLKINLKIKKNSF